MPKARLTDIAVSAIKPNGKQATYWDTTLAGFGVRVSQAGAKSWVVMTGRERKLTTFGRYPEMSLKAARVKARDLITNTKPKDATELTLNEARTLFLADAEARTKTRTHRDYTRLLTRHLKPIEEMVLQEVTTKNFTDILDGLKDTPSEQHHAFMACRIFLRFCVGRRFLTHSPLEALRAPKKPTARNHVLPDTQLKQIALTALKVHSAFGHIVLLCLYTGMRRGESAQLRWEWIDDKARTITLPATVTKNSHEHYFPYGSAVHDLLPLIHSREGYLFPGRDSTEQFFNGWSRSKKAFDELCGVSDWSLHDLRRTFATNLAALGTPIHVTEKLLNHVSGSTGGIVGIYQRHAYWEEQQAAIAAWEKKLGSLIGR